MDWSPQQDKALQAVEAWLTAKDKSQPIFRLFGYAGTGKTTLAKHFAQNISQVIFGAFTGKAAHVMRKKGCPGAATLHSLIYHPRDKSKESLKKYEAEYGDLILEKDKHTTRLKQLEKLLSEEKESLRRPAFTLNPDSVLKFASLIIIDECSMVGSRMGEDLLSFGKPILVLGDPAQLPPIADTGFFTNQTPQILLTEIHRQAKDNPIIAMATKVREGEALPLGQYGSSRIINKKEMNQEDATGADQILVGRNKIRISINNRMRQIYNKTKLVEEGDKLVCLRNNQEIGILNGSKWNVKDTSFISEDRCILSLEDDEKKQIDLEAHTHYFKGLPGKDIPFYERREAEEFDFGYALTTHKAQGSQWDNVLLFDESSAFRDDSRKWLYTAITRAAEKITILR